MYKRTIEKLLSNRSWIVIGLAVVAAIGLYSFSGLPIDAIPDITNTQVVVSIKTGALEPEQIEKTVTYYVETELAGVPRVKDTRSISKFGLSQTVVIFDDGVDIYWARQQVAERLQAVRGQLPEGLSPEIGPVSTGLGEVLIYALKAKPGTALAGKSEFERLLYLRTINDFIVRPYLKSSIPNNAEIDAIGGYKKEYHVDFYPARLVEYGITLDEVVKKLGTIGETYGGGAVERAGKQVIIRTDGSLAGIGDIADLPVKLTGSGRHVLLRQIADVRVGSAIRMGAATLRGRETVLGSVFMLLGANSRVVVEDSEKAIRALPLPRDVEIEVVYSRSFLVDATMRTVGTNLAEGAALVVVVLLLLLGNVRAAIIVALAIPVSMLAAIAGMRLFGISANLMSLGAVDFGLLVEGSVVVIENYLRRVQEREGARHEVPPLRERISLLMSSVKETAKPVLFGLSIVLIVYLPILALEGIEGKMFRPMALTVLMAIGASLVVAMIAMPVLAHFSLWRRKREEQDALFFRVVRRLYGPVLRFGIRHWILLGVLALGALAATTVAYSKLGSDFVPQLDEGDMSIALVRDYNIGLDEALRRQELAERVILSFPEVERTFSRIGTAESAADPMSINMADTYVILKKDRSAWTVVDGRRRGKQELFDAIKQAIEKVDKDQEIVNSQPIELRFNEILEGSRADVALRIYGPELAVLEELAEKAETLLKKLPGATVEMDPITALRKKPVHSLRVDHRRLNLYGASLGEVNETLDIALNGRRVGSYYEADWRFPIILRLAEPVRKNLWQLGTIPVSADENGMVPLASLTTATEAERVANIARNKSRRYSAVSIYLTNRDTASYVAEARAALGKDMPLPEGYFVEWGGQFRNLEAAQARLLVIVPLVLAAIFLLILRGIGSWRHALLVYLSIPFAASGGVFALALGGITFSVTAAVGFIALFGIAILNALVLVTFIKNLADKGVPALDAAYQGAMLRLRPVLMTALVASVGFLPMVLNTGIGSEVQRPLATVVIGGLVTSVFMVLVLLPALCARIGVKKRTQPVPEPARPARRGKR